MQHKRISKNSDIIELPYYCFRNITGPEDKANNRTIYSGQVPISAIVDIPTHENVRDYLAELDGKPSRALTKVHRAIKDTLINTPEMFSILNSGIVMVAREFECDEKNMILKLSNPSIINGSQTKGVVKDLLEERALGAITPHVKFELIITHDADLIADVAIARNFQNNVQTVSILGRRGVFDDLENALQAEIPTKRLQKSETDHPTAENDFYATEKLIRVIAALLPESLWWKSGSMNKAYTYSSKAAALNDYQEIWKGAKDTEHLNHVKLKEVYNFYISMAATALRVYEKWKRHTGFKDSGLQARARKEEIVAEVPDGIIFPILAAFSVFVTKERRQWILKIPEALDDRELIQAAKIAYAEIAKNKPHLMGTTKACYSQLEQLTRIYKNLTQHK